MTKRSAEAELAEIESRHLIELHGWLIDWLNAVVSSSGDAAVGIIFPGADNRAEIVEAISFFESGMKHPSPDNDISVTAQLLRWHFSGLANKVASWREISRRWRWTAVDLPELVREP